MERAGRGEEEYVRAASVEGGAPARFMNSGSANQLRLHLKSPFAPP